MKGNDQIYLDYRVLHGSSCFRCSRFDHGCLSSWVIQAKIIRCFGVIRLSLAPVPNQSVLPREQDVWSSGRPHRLPFFPNGSFGIPSTCPLSPALLPRLFSCQIYVLKQMSAFLYTANVLHYPRGFHRPLQDGRPWTWRHVIA